MSDVNQQISDAELRRHHRRARKASIAQWIALGTEHGVEDAVECYATLSLSNAAATQQLQRQKMTGRKRRLETAGVPAASICAWLDAHTKAFASHFALMTSRSGPKISRHLILIAAQ